MDVTVSYANQDSGEWELLCSLSFPPLSNSWMREGRMPTEEEILPKRQILLPSGATMELGLVYEPRTQQANLSAFQGGKQLLLVMSRNLQCAIFSAADGSILQVLTALEADSFDT